jgi:hypothetical protein
MKRLVLLLMLALATGSCTMTREIRVVTRSAGLAIDFPWSFWRVIGLQDREYPRVDRVELFDRERLLWSLASADPSGVRSDAKMPIRIGGPNPGFIAKGDARLRPGVYGVWVSSNADARVDFELSRDGSVRNITDRSEMMEAPCGAYWNAPCDRSQVKEVGPGSGPGGERK